MLRPRTLKEGSVGLFALLGLAIIGGIVLWLRGGGFGNPGYQVLVEFADASGLQVGAPVNYRGIAVGKVTHLIPGSNGVNVQMEIGSTQLRIPHDVAVEISRYGLLGEAAIEMIPPGPLSEKALAIDPLGEACGESQKILCDGDQLQGDAGNQLISSMTRLSQAYSDPQFVADINATVRSASIAANRIAKMSDEITKLANTANTQVRGLGQTTEAIAGAANNAATLTENLNQIVLLNQAHATRTLQEASVLMTNLNQLVGENRQQVSRTLNSIYQTSEDLQTVSRDLDVTVLTLNDGLSKIDSKQVAENLSAIMANTRDTTDNLRQISTELNNPTLLLSLQKTLDAARVTFENAQKITSDVEQLTGDPTFRTNLKKLVNGLEQLVSSAENLQGQVYTAHTLERSTQQLHFQIDRQQQLAQYYQHFQPDTIVPPSPQTENPPAPGKQPGKQ
ncbi:MAG: MlaD family protein [Synechocystis sp.]|nr:MlaD family protein [Synechocystis sp.]